MVLVEPPLNNELWETSKLLGFIRDLRKAADDVSPGMPVAGQLPVTADMFEAVLRDGPRATLFAFLAVLMLVIFLFRNIRIISLALFALLLGVTWMAGAILGFHLKINFLNFIALPITFGIGIDYGVNIFQRYRQEGRGSILRVIRYTGGAVALASLTTIIGYSSLLIAGNQAFVSFGRLAVLGEITCLFAAMISLPAYLCYKDSK
jgi:predicted RND superfamily exporter protein